MNTPEPPLNRLLARVESLEHLIPDLVEVLVPDVLEEPMQAVIADGLIDRIGLLVDHLNRARYALVCELRCS